VQFSVFLANRVGELKEMLDLFLSQSVRILGLSIVDSTDWAVIRTVFSDANKAREILRRHPLPFTESEVLLAVLDSEKDLSRICELLIQMEINVHFAYPLAVRSAGKAVMVFHVDDLAPARAMLARHDVTLLGHEDLSGPV